MGKPAIDAASVQGRMGDIERLLHGDDADSDSAIVRFDMGRVATTLGIPQRMLMVRMLRVLAVALAVEAAELADSEMQQQGDRLGVDGYPEGWPDLHLAAVTRLRLFPELEQ